MGGSGSGWQGPKKNIVEDCLVLSISDLIRQRLIVPASYRSGSLEWSYEGASEPFARIGYEADLRNMKSTTLHLQYVCNDKAINQWVWLKHTEPHYGGSRWWFRCPILQIRVGKLYLPPNEFRFASRKAHKLTYRSCQKSGLLARLCRQMARELGLDEANEHHGPNLR